MKYFTQVRFLECLFLLLISTNLFSQNNENILLKKGSFFIGSNYLASHAGLQMWTNWNPVIIEEDFKKLSDAGVEVLRIFPIWSDFQPITAIRNASSTVVDFRFGENRLPDNSFGYAGVSEEMINRLKFLLDLGEKYRFKFIVTLLSGHMSGRIYIPPALDGNNPISDPTTIQWEIRYIKCLVSELKNHKAIVGWGLGNETNCMANSTITRQQAFVWSSIIANTIRSIDPSKPVLSDMHGLLPDGTWSILDQGEITDILTTHPYPLFTAYCDQEPINTIRPILHGSAESKFYGDIGNKPVLIEEMGSLGPMFSDNNICADFFRTSTFSAWANDFHSTMWWSNIDFSNLTSAPYDWRPIERELGLFNVDGSPKPIVKEMRNFRNFYSNFPYQNLPNVEADAVCIITKGQDQWAVAQSAFILSKQAGLNIEFQYCTQPIKDAQIYLLPSVSGPDYISKSRMDTLLQRVKNGATLYISMSGDALFTGFESITGLRVVTRERIKNDMDFKFQNTPMILSSGVHYVFENAGANVLSGDKSGNPVFTKFKYGNGDIYLLTAPLESSLAGKSGCFDKKDATPFWKIYKEIGEKSKAKHILTKSNPLLGITEHLIDNNKCIAIIINYSPESISDIIEIRKGWVLQKTYYGKTGLNDQNLSAEISKNNALVIELTRKD
jgi:hypothetical protein